MQEIAPRTRGRPRKHPAPEPESPAASIETLVSEQPRFLPAGGTHSSASKAIDPHPVPVMPENATLTERAISERPPDRTKEPSASFVSRYREYRLGLDPHVVERVGDKMVTVPGSGRHIQFHNWNAVVYGEDLIRRCLGHGRFGKDFEIDLRDPTGYWERTGRIRVRMVTTKKTELVDADGR